MQRVFSFEIRLEAVRLHEEGDKKAKGKNKENKGNKEKLKKTKESKK